MTIPYGKIMVLTTDRPDIWQKLVRFITINPINLIAYGKF